MCVLLNLMIHHGLIFKIYMHVLKTICKFTSYISDDSAMIRIVMHMYVCLSGATYVAHVFTLNVII